MLCKMCERREGSSVVVEGAPCKWSILEEEAVAGQAFAGEEIRVAESERPRGVDDKGTFR
jgi:hypothetical protein